jgi:hypothetical protein
VGDAHTDHTHPSRTLVLAMLIAYEALRSSLNNKPLAACRTQMVPPSPGLARSESRAESPRLLIRKGGESDPTCISLLSSTKYS